jgi:hypothetical protein
VISCCTQALRVQVVIDMLDCPYSYLRFFNSTMRLQARLNMVVVVMTMMMTTMMMTILSFYLASYLPFLTLLPVHCSRKPSCRTAANSATPCTKSSPLHRRATS